MRAASSRTFSTGWSFPYKTEEKNANDLLNVKNWIVCGHRVLWIYKAAPMTVQARAKNLQETNPLGGILRPLMFCLHCSIADRRCLNRVSWGIISISIWVLVRWWCQIVCITLSEGDAGKLGKYPTLSVLQDKFAKLLYDIWFSSLGLPPLPRDSGNFDVHGGWWSHQRWSGMVTISLHFIFYSNHYY